ncbi:phenylalanine--tRNA ligase subunit beta [Mycoplasmopsis canis]|uniref:phenylalanine--tRNA ligase subunit beta n=1 Tax=Mycoplasmopsis cynos TaxID=171284 RepID=UPI002AFE382A|nr:phenylalanine--tRNA ligase subunit beta [Mycoplasmopsis cynos]WQQ12820.1 phenylalanine--tRNA ligase subunit beta [Mycoplasmopsis cynos]WQQ14029.1 phenylalanine--tRNA ligase subunit beta [Mycoplasmopsis cynos]
MILSLKHLNKYLPSLELKPKNLEVALNELGFEVEWVKPFANVKGLIFAKVLDVFMNPNSDRLDVVKLETKFGQLTIQTTNRILKYGDLIICFPVGASKDGVEFKEIILKGYPSQGMMASWSEIGYDWTLLSEKDQILVLPNDFASINDDPMELLNINDTIIEISTTANRNDANSYYFLAKELAAYFKTEFKPLFSFNKQSDFISEFKVQKNLAKEISFLEVKTKDIKQNSIYEKTLLAKHGISSLFNWAVNLSNLTLIEIGSPAHVYDANKISPNISTALYSGKLEILGAKEVEVNDVLAIKDDYKVISLACVMGLEATKSTSESNRFLFEIGVFDPKMVRHGAKEIKLNTNSASQGSRVISQEVAWLGMEYIKAYCKGLEISKIINEIKLDAKRAINFNSEKLRTYAGVDDLRIFDHAIKQLENLGFEFINSVVYVPNYRYDVLCFEDIIEEIFRFYSYQNFKPQEVRIAPLKTLNINNDKYYWMHNGYSEARTFSLVSIEKNKFNPWNILESFNLMTYVSKERESIRKSIIISLQEAVSYNLKRKIDQLSFFEHGMIANQTFVYGLASTNKTFKELQQDIINFLNLDLEFIKFEDNEYIHPNVSARIFYQNKYIGWIGKIHPKYDDTNAFYAEFIIPEQKSKLNKYQNVNFEPLKNIDLTFEIPNNGSINEIILNINKIHKPFSIKVVDDYQKEHSHNVTLRISDYETNIEKINKHFN